MDLKFIGICTVLRNYIKTVYSDRETKCDCLANNRQNFGPGGVRTWSLADGVHCATYCAKGAAVQKCTY